MMQHERTSDLKHAWSMWTKSVKLVIEYQSATPIEINMESRHLLFNTVATYKATGEVTPCVTRGYALD